MGCKMEFLQLSNIENWMSYANIKFKSCICLSDFKYLYESKQKNPSIQTNKPTKQKKSKQTNPNEPAALYGPAQHLHWWSIHLCLHLVHVISPPTLACWLHQCNQSKALLIAYWLCPWTFCKYCGSKYKRKSAYCYCGATSRPWLTVSICFSPFLPPYLSTDPTLSPSTLPVPYIVNLGLKFSEISHSFWLNWSALTLLLPTEPMSNSHFSDCFSMDSNLQNYITMSVFDGSFNQ